MKVWELEENKVYICNGTKYFVDYKGCLHHKKILERNGCESWFISNLTFNEIRNMEFQETNFTIWC